MTANNGAVMSLKQPETPLAQTIGALTQLEPEPNSSLFSHSLSSWADIVALAMAGLGYVKAWQQRRTKMKNIVQKYKRWALLLQ